MKWFLLIASFTLLLSCKQNKTATESSPKTESLLLTMERTPCFGRCPNYKITISNTGNVAYEGFSFVEKEGKYTKKLSQKQLTEIHSQIELIKLFEMDDKYDSQITDIPSVHLSVTYNNQNKKILDRVDAPKELKQFEKLIDHLVIDDELKKVEE